MGSALFGVSAVWGQRCLGSALFGVSAVWGQRCLGWPRLGLLMPEGAAERVHPSSRTPASWACRNPPILRLLGSPPSARASATSSSPLSPRGPVLGALACGPCTVPAPVQGPLGVLKCKQLLGGRSWEVALACGPCAVPAPVQGPLLVGVLKCKQLLVGGLGRSRSCLGSTLFGVSAVWGQRCLGSTLRGVSAIWGQRCLGSTLFGVNAD